MPRMPATEEESAQKSNLLLSINKGLHLFYLNHVMILWHKYKFCREENRGSKSFSNFPMATKQSNIT